MSRVTGVHSLVSDHIDEETLEGVTLLDELPDDPANPDRPYVRVAHWPHDIDRVDDLRSTREELVVVESDPVEVTTWGVGDDREPLMTDGVDAALEEAVERARRDGLPILDPIHSITLRDD